MCRRPLGRPLDGARTADTQIVPNRGLSQIPETARLSFDEAGTLLEHGDADAKFTAMNIAAAQARKRGEAAKDWVGGGGSRGGGT